MRRTGVAAAVEAEQINADEHRRRKARLKFHRDPYPRRPRYPRSIPSTRPDTAGVLTADYADNADGTRTDWKRVLPNELILVVIDIGANQTESNQKMVWLTKRDGNLGTFPSFLSAPPAKSSRQLLVLPKIFGCCHIDGSW